MRTLLIILIGFVGITSTLIGMLLIAYPIVSAYGLSMDALNTAFATNFALPGTMFFLTGAVHLTALLSCMQRNRTQYSWSLIAAVAMIAWIVTHSLLLQTMPWLYSTYLLCSLLILLLSWQLKGRWAV